MNLVIPHSLIYSILFLIYLIAFSLFKLHNVAIIGLIGLSTILFLLRKNDVILFLFALYLPLNGIFYKSTYLFGVINFDIITSLIALFVLIQLPGMVAPDKKQSILISIISLMWIYITYTYFRLAYTGASSLKLIDSVHKAVYYSLHYFPLLLIVRKWYNPMVRKNILLGIQTSIVFLTTTLLISPILSSLGLKLGMVNDFFGEISKYRHFGFFGLGDANSLGVLFTIYIGYLFIKNERNKKEKLFNFEYICSIIGILFTASRAAIIALAIIHIIYFFRNRNEKTIRLVLVMSLVFIAILPISRYSFSRFSNINTQFDLNTTSNRIGKWIVYYDYMMERPKSLLFGANEAIIIGKEARAAHNAYIQMVFNAGVIPVVFLFLFFWLYYRHSKKNKDVGVKSTNYYLVIPFVLNTVSVSEWGTFYYFIIFLLSNRDEKK